MQLDIVLIDWTCREVRFTGLHSITPIKLVNGCVCRSSVGVCLRLVRLKVQREFQCRGTEETSAHVQPVSIINMAICLSLTVAVLCSLFITLGPGGKSGAVTCSTRKLFLTFPLLCPPHLCFFVFCFFFAGQYNFVSSYSFICLISLLSTVVLLTLAQLPPTSFLAHTASQSLWLDFPSFFPTIPLCLSSSRSLSPSLSAPAPRYPLPPSQYHCVHMAPACDMKLSQNTPDARFSPPLFQTLLNFKQNKRKRKGGRSWREKGEKKQKKWARGARGMCNNITISFIHSSRPRASSVESSPLILAPSLSPPFTPLVWKPSSLSLPPFSLYWTGLIVALTTDLGSDYFVGCPSVGLKNNWLCSCCLHGQLPSQLPRGYCCPSDAFLIPNGERRVTELEIISHCLLLLLLVLFPHMILLITLLLFFPLSKEYHSTAASNIESEQLGRL